MTAARLGFRALRLVLILCLLGGLLLLFETRFIYFPSRGYDATPSGLALPHEDVWLVAEDGVRIHGWYLPVPDARWVTLVSHGNAGNIGHRLDRALLLQSRLRSSVFLYDYRGYGESEGSPDEAGTYRDARAAYRYLVEQKQVKADELVLFGESLGSAVSLELALDHPAAALVLEAPFTSVRDMARATVFAPLAPFVRTRYESLARVPRLRMPLLVVQGDRDEVVPPAQGRRLFDAAPEPKRYYSIPGAGHNDTYLVGGAAYWRAVEEFLDAVGRGGAGSTMSENG
ncbi:MAG TPA: alpha/beta hydrolase [Vicinamibacteria bacterium]|nr:alpha/beta hydrolase [Vicinamibacteria bacterium]